MKYTKFTLLLLLGIISSSVIAQTKNSRISSEEITLDGHKFFEMSVEDAIQAFGQPLSIEDYYYETEDLYAKKVEYEGARLFFVDNRGDGFTITGPDIAVTKHKIRVGQSVLSLLDIYPHSHKYRKSNTNLSLTLLDYEKFLSFSYGIGTGKSPIYEIHLGGY
jgi:hypothetical protein